MCYYQTLALLAKCIWRKLDLIRTHTLFYVASLQTDINVSSYSRYVYNNISTT
jgi:hypothetical protein